DGIGAGVVNYLCRAELGPPDIEDTENINSSVNARTASEISSDRRVRSRDDFNETSKL
ncbi:unnamed protein product, partial [Rotaria magnacalcarata]